MPSFFSPAKINLFLKILEQRSDGFHNLASLFQTVSLGDTLIIELAEKDHFSSSDTSLLMDSSNLIVKALALFRKKTGVIQPLSIHINKNIPIEAGLGGGSSNAATLLWACNQLLKQNIPLSILMEWGAELGSDVPFFFSEGTAYCRGRGEHVLNLRSLSQQESLTIIKPRLGLSTQAIFKNFAKNRKDERSNKTENFYLDAFLNQKLPPFNDLEESAFTLSPELKSLKSKLLASGFSSVMMTGSGSAFFCFGEGQPPNQEDIFSFPVHFINRDKEVWYSFNEKNV